MAGPIWFLHQPSVTFTARVISSLTNGKLAHIASNRIRGWDFETPIIITETAHMALNTPPLCDLRRKSYIFANQWVSNYKKCSYLIGNCIVCLHSLVNTVVIPLTLPRALPRALHTYLLPVRCRITRAQDHLTLLRSRSKVYTLLEILTVYNGNVYTCHLFVR